MEMNDESLDVLTDREGLPKSNDLLRAGLLVVISDGQLNISST